MEIPSFQSCPHGLSVSRVNAVEHLSAKTTRQWTFVEDFEAKLHHVRPGFGSA